MKILEAQNSVLSNHEVVQHLVNHQARHKARSRAGPATIVTEVRLVIRSRGATKARELINLTGAEVPPYASKPVS